MEGECRSALPQVLAYRNVINEESAQAMFIQQTTLSKNVYIK
jgi:hypothetical protein